MTTLEVLKAAREHLSDPARWCKHSFLITAPNSGRPACCAIGAIRLQHSCLTGSAISRLDAALPEDWQGAVFKYSNRPSPPENWKRGAVNYNDDPRTTHADILALFDRAIAAEEARQ